MENDQKSIKHWLRNEGRRVYFVLSGYQVAISLVSRDMAKIFSQNVFLALYFRAQTKTVGYVTIP